jgi:hypothetical protein
MCSQEWTMADTAREAIIVFRAAYLDINHTPL